MSNEEMYELYSGPNSSHPNSIIHIDIDCFYAQVEMILNPELRNVPLGIQQKQIIVTSNYLARDFGIKKCMYLDDGLKLCPQLVLVKGEDLSKYRKMSQNIFLILQSFGIPVERLGMDENFLDVTTIVNDKVLYKSKYSNIEGQVYGIGEALCPCDCRTRLTIASHIAKEIRNKLWDDLGITCCAGIAHNKLLAKIVGSLHKPNQQTTIFPENGTLLMSTLPSVRFIPGIGVKTIEVLDNLNVKSVADLQKCEFSDLRMAFSSEIASNLKNLGAGFDTSIVKQSTRPLSIGIEDSFRIIDTKNALEDKINELLMRLIEYVVEDGRIPSSLRLTVRKQEPDKQDRCIRLSKQTQISKNHFVKKENGSLSLGSSSFDQFFVICMRLFSSIIDISEPFHLTLLGLTFSKFTETKSGESLTSHFLKKNESVENC